MSEAAAVPAVAPVEAPVVPAVAPTVAIGPPAVAPVIPAPVEPKPEGKAPAVEPTGDPGLDYALGFIYKAGIQDDHPAMQAAYQGDFGLLKALLAEKGAAGWEQAVALGEQAYGKFKASAEADAKSVGEAVTQVAEAMGVDWEEAVKWARGAASKEEAATVNEMLQSPATAKMAALWIAHNYSNQQGVDVAPRQKAVSDAAVPQPPAASGGTIDRVEFSREAGKLHKKYGDTYNQTPEYRALANRLAR